MPYKTFLTQDIVDGASPINRRELWISDTKVKGFGLRVWRNRNGELRKHFAIRVTDHTGRYIRRSLDFGDALSFHYSLDENNSHFDTWIESRPETLGQLTESARIWAAAEIRDVKAIGPSQTQISAALKKDKVDHRLWVQSRVKWYTFEKSCDVVLRGVYNRGASLEYCVRLDQLFHKHVPDSLKRKVTRLITAKEITEIFSDKSLSEPTLELLRPLISKCFKIPLAYGIECSFQPSDIPKLVSTVRSNQEEINIFESWTIANQRDFLSWLLDIEDIWPEALCFLLYLETPAPLSQLKCLEMAHMFQYVDSINPDPHRAELLKFEQPRPRTIRLNLVCQNAILQAEKRQQQLNLKTDYLFPSLSNARNRPISSVNRILVRVVDRFNLPSTTPRKMKSEWMSSSATKNRYRVDLRRITRAA